MRNPLHKRFKREIITHAGRYVAILIIFIVMVTIISGFLVVANGVRLAYDNDRLENKVEDGSFSSERELLKNEIAKIQRLGVTVSQNFYLDAETRGGQTVRLYQTRNEVNLPTIWEGHLPSGKNEIALERLFADKHKLSVGSTIELDEKEVTVSALISLPDYSSLFIKNTDLMMDSFGFGVAIVTPELFESFRQDKTVYNYAYRYQNRNLSEREQIDLSDEIKKNLVNNEILLTGFMMAQDNQSISFVSEDMGSDVPMMKIFLYIIQVIMAFVFTVIIISSIESDSSVIGCLLASGYKKGELVRHYLTLPVMVTLIGALMGNVLSYTAGIPLFKRIYYNAYSLPPMVVRFNPEAFLLTTFLPIVLVLLVNTIMLYRKLSLSPLKFLRRDLRRRKQKKAVQLPDISFLGRFRLRVILQNLGSYAILFFGMLFASFILLFGLSMRPTVEQYVKSIEKAAVSEYQYILKAPYQGEIDEDAEGFTTHILETYYKQADKNLEVTFYGVSDVTKYWGIHTKNIGEKDVIISDSLSKKLGVKKGEYLSFADSYNQKEYTLRVAGIKPYPGGFAAFMEFGAMNRMFDRDTQWINGYVSDKKLEIPEKYVAAVITAEDMTKLGGQMTSSFRDMAAICLAASIVMHLVIMYILTKVIVDRNAQNISFMKVMGYQNKEIRKLYLTSTIIAVTACLLLSLPLIDIGLRGAFIFAFIRINGYLEAYLPLYLFAVVFAAGFVSYMIINLLHMHRINKIGLAEVLKNRE